MSHRRAQLLDHLRAVLLRQPRELQLRRHRDDGRDVEHLGAQHVLLLQLLLNELEHGEELGQQRSVGQVHERGAGLVLLEHVVLAVPRLVRAVRHHHAQQPVQVAVHLVVQEDAEGEAREGPRFWGRAPAVSLLEVDDVRDEQRDVVLQQHRVAVILVVLVPQSRGDRSKLQDLSGCIRSRERQRAPVVFAEAALERATDRQKEERRRDLGPWRTEEGKVLRSRTMPLVR